jgi:hypothetical protein
MVEKHDRIALELNGQIAALANIGKGCCAYQARCRPFYLISFVRTQLCELISILTIHIDTLHIDWLRLQAPL